MSTGLGLGCVLHVDPWAGVAGDMFWLLSWTWIQRDRSWGRFWIRRWRLWRSQGGGWSPMRRWRGVYGVGVLTWRRITLRSAVRRTSGPLSAALRSPRR